MGHCSPKVLPSVEYLRECFDYDPESGELRWKERPLAHFCGVQVRRLWNARYAGKPVGYLDPTRANHGRVIINNEKYGTYRVVWKLVTGQGHGLYK